MNASSFGRSLAVTMTSALFGLIFGLGLIVSHMVDPQRVTDFLDIAGTWNPALAFVMGGAIVVAAPAFAYTRRHRGSVLSGTVELPDRFRISARLVVGAALFGIGWGISGICPGPGLTLLTSFEPRALVFIAALAAGIRITDLATAAKPADQEDLATVPYPAD